jgi:hypothetical protein
MVRKDNSYCLQVRNISGNEELLTLYEHLDFWWGPCCLSILVFCVMCFYLCYFVLCSVPSVTCVSGLSILDYKSFFFHFIIKHIFGMTQRNVYLYQLIVIYQLYLKQELV